MTNRLIKVAKELNVGTGTIVEFLNSHGYDIENKPTAQVTDEMYGALLKEFQKSREIAIQANQMVIGRNQQPAHRKESSFPASDISAKPPVKKAEELEARRPAEQESREKPKVEEPIDERRQVSRLKVLGKIDLESRLRSKAAGPGSRNEPETVEKRQPEAMPPQAEKPAVVEEAPAFREERPAEVPVREEPVQPQPVQQEAVVLQPAPEPEPERKPAPEPQPKTEAPVVEEKKKEVKQEELLRAETPELRGLKILGKIDTEKFNRPKKKKKKEKEKEKPRPVEDRNRKPAPPATSTAPGGAPSAPSDREKEDEAARKKRRRKRKKVPVEGNAPSSSGGGGGGGNAGGGGKRRGAQQPPRTREEEAKEVSQREIEEKIKATMARLSGGSKKKRQRLQRDKRDRIREKEEARQAEQLTDKLQVTEFISVSELAGLMDVAVTDVIMTCLNLGIIVSINQRLDAEVIELVASEFGHEVEFISVEEQDEEEEEVIDEPEDLRPRPPIVTVMGHVDHGKTSLLDYIRSANVVAGEAGGITQHIGAYEVMVGDDESKRITFLDTPGHEAFTAMRARGAKVTDIAVIIVAADDSVMPQTREAISHAQAAGVPIVFAINKVDKPGADPGRIKNDLAQMNLLVEEWGGKYQSQDVSAKTGQGIDSLLEKILLEAELLDLKANPDRFALGTVLEASLDKGRGYVTKVLIQTGTLKIGDPIVSGGYSGKVKAMFNERGKRVTSVGPSQPTLVLGLDGAPQAGERFKVVANEHEARQIASKRAQIAREQANRATKRISLDEIGRRLALGTFKELNLIVKGDFDGSVEALSDSLIKLSQETVQVNVIHRAVGQIIESDVMLASASDAIIIGFQVRPSSLARRLAEQEGVQIKTYSIIYEAIEEVKAAIEGMLEPTKEEKIIAQIDVREVYKISKVGTIAGCYVQEGKIVRNNHIRLVRNGIVVFPTREGAHGKIASLKRFKEDVKEVKSGLECGIAIENFNDIKVGDVIEGYEIVEIKQTLE